MVAGVSPASNGIGSFGSCTGPKSQSTETSGSLAVNRMEEKPGKQAETAGSLANLFRFAPPCAHDGNRTLCVA